MTYTDFSGNPRQLADWIEEALKGRPINEWGHVEHDFELTPDEWHQVIAALRDRADNLKL
jgi:hypothetical protein